MIKITNNEGREIVVTKGVYEDLYKPLGYVIKSENKVDTPKMVENDVKKEETKAEEIKDKVEDEEPKANFKRK